MDRYTSEWSVPSEAGLILIYSVGLVCGYVDWLIYRRYTVIHTIAKYIRTYSGEDPDTLELQKYEIHMNDTRTNNEFFLSDRYTHFFSSLLISLGAPMLLLLRLSLIHI